MLVARANRSLPRTGDERPSRARRSNLGRRQQVASHSKGFSRLRRIAAVVAFAFALVPSAHAEGGAPEITLVAPGTALRIPLNAAKHPIFAWKIAFAQTPDAPTTISFDISTDPSFEGWKYSERQVCPVSTPGCFTGTVPHGYDWLDEANGGAPYPEGGTVTLYWRVTVDLGFGSVPVSATSWFTGVPIPPDTTAPSIFVPTAHAKRGVRARVVAKLADDGLLFNATARLFYGDRILGTASHDFFVPRGIYVLWIDLPKYAPKGRYKLCVDATDLSLNWARRCAPVFVS